MRKNLIPAVYICTTISCIIRAETFFSNNQIGWFITTTIVGYLAMAYVIDLLKNQKK